ncbi:BatA domain-containing protein [Hymenobacter rigui]|uniref:BatA domain-containing protein n=1 Tax=Hymenobacter rigui TaxID=334424 RepID=UPI00147778F2|nr:BatA domain-containing protein [Hymenobacter rigui]
MLPLIFSHVTAGWLALLGLAVPLAIYLWNRRPGHVVRVGSIRWLEAAANRRLRSLRPEQLLLFLLRAALVALLALAVAEPAQLLPAPPLRGQVLLAPGVTKADVKLVQPALDSLRQRGYQLRQLHTERPVSAPLPWASAGLGDTTTAARLPLDSARSINLWHTVQAADSLPGRPLVVVAPLTLAGFTGTRAALPAQVQWLPLPQPDSSTQAVAAWQPHPDSLTVLVASGSETSLRVQKIRRRWPAAGSRLRLLPGVEIRTDAQRHVYVLHGSRQQPLPVIRRQPRWHVSYDAAHAASGRVVMAALRAIGPVLPLAPRLTVAAELPSDSLDWLFWLRDAPAPAARSRHIWQEASQKASVLPTQFQPVGASQPIAVQRLDTAAPAGTVVWQTASRHALLSEQPAGHLLLHTRLDPAWSGLADSPELPNLLLPLLQPVGLTIPVDTRPLAITQLQSARPATSGAVEPLAPHRPLTPWLVLAAGLLFAAERLLAARRPGTSPVTPLS